MSDQTIAGAILAGGQARRFGGLDKSRLTIPDGRTIIVRQCALLQRVAGDVFIVTTRADRTHRPDRFADLGVPVVTDLIDEAGALGAIHAALSHATADRVLVVACDLPFLEEGLLRTLADRAASADGAWVRTARGPEPLIACYRRQSLPRITAALLAGERRAGALGELLTLHDVGPDVLETLGDPDRMLTNVNTPDDYSRVQYRAP